MNEPKYTEETLQNTLRDSENKLDRATLDSLAEARETALHTDSSLFGRYRGFFSAGLVTAAFFVVIALPLGEESFSISQNTEVAMVDESLQLLMEDPEFFLWVSDSYGSVTQ